MDHRKREKRQAPSVKGIPAVRPNAPVGRDEPYSAPAPGDVQNTKTEYELQSPSSSI